MKRVSLIVVVLLVGILVPVFADSASTEQHGRSVEGVLQEILTSLSLGPRDRIDPDQVDERLLEELGEALMSRMVPDPTEHA